jgi:site-specific DNA-methyltransferase (adenine-specific)
VIELHNADCLAVMRGMAGNSVSAIITDPPYFQIKGGFDWDYKDHAHYLEFMEQCAVEWKRILKKNGSLLVFGHAKRIAYIQVMLDKYFNLENSLVWEKSECQTKIGIEQFRCFAPVTERILFYSCEVERTGLEEIKLDVNNFAPLRDYFRRVQEFIGLNKTGIMNKVGHRADHCFQWKWQQWDIPTPETYTELIAVFGIDRMDGFNQYEALRNQYEALRNQYEALRRPFNNTHRLTDVIKHSQEAHITKDYAHDTVKPVGLMAKLIETVTKRGDTVLDPFMGSGTTGAACKLLNRSFIGCELDAGYFEIAQNRINSIGAFDDVPMVATVTTTKTTTITKTVTKTKTVEFRQADLFV